MTIEILNGSAAESAGQDGEFSGTLSPRNIRVSEALTSRVNTLLSSAFRGSWGSSIRLAEAFSTSDFKLAAFAALDSEMLTQYAEIPANWRAYTTVTTVNDFRPKRLLNRWRNTVGMDPVPELTEYPSEDTRNASDYAISVAKYGRRFSLSWEAWVNNEAIGELEDLPGELARQASETESINALSNLLNINPSTKTATDVNTAFFKSANGNAPTNLPLTLDNLDAALTALASKKSPTSGRVVASPALQVVIPRSLEQVANRIKATRLIRRVEGANTVEYDNYLSSVEFVVDPMLDFLNTHAKAATTWFIVPKSGQPQPALWAAFLRGHETPDLRVKSDTGQRVGGGEISALEGSFDIDDIQYRGRHIVGHQTGDPTFTYVSYGS